MRARYLGRAVGVMLITLVVLCGGVSPASAITRDQVLTRARTWVDHPVPYSQSKYYGGYRTDCSGYVSMCWNLLSGTSPYSTSTAYMHDYAYPITSAQLKPGDVLLKAGSHVRLFVGWADVAHSAYVCYEQTPPQTKSSVKSLATDISDGYIPYRYNKITDTVASWNLYQNDTFDIWSGGSPVWCAFTSDVPGASYAAATDVKRTGNLALRLVNPVASVSSNADLKQTIAVTAGNQYTASVWACSAMAPDSVQLHILYLDAAGALVPGGFGVGGGAFGVNPATFKQLTLSSVAPAGAAQAVIYLRLTGGTTGGVAGGSAVFDDAAAWVSSPLPIYRFYSAKLGSHFYTASGLERDAVIDALSSKYTYEGVCYSVKTLVAANDHPLYRFYNKSNGTHFYTASEAEKNRVLATLSATYQFDGPAYNVCVTPVPAATPVYRFYNKSNGSHFYTASETEKANTIAKSSATYSLEGVAFYLAQ